MEEKMNMVMTMIKNEENLAISAASQVRRVKRRRRDASAAVLNCDSEQTANKQTGSTCATTTAKRSSRFRGVSKHRWTGRYEAHLWDKLSWNVTQKKKGKQVYLGAYDDEEAAARAYDLAALKYWGTSTFINFPISDYETEIEVMQTVTKEGYLASLRRKSSGFARGVSKYRGVARYKQSPTARKKRQIEHMTAAIEYRGINAVTNFDLSTYIRWLKPGANMSIPVQETKPSPKISSVLSIFPCLKRKAFSADDLNEQNTLAGKVPRSPPTRSSTVLGLLLRSSIFRELVEKNPNISEEDEYRENTKNVTAVGYEDEFGGIFCDGIEDIPFVMSSNGNNIELQGQVQFDYDFAETEIYGRPLSPNY